MFRLRLFAGHAGGGDGQHDRGGPHHQRDWLAEREGGRRDGVALHTLDPGDAGVPRGWHGTAGERRLDGEFCRDRRSAKAPGNVVRDGMGGVRMRMYVSEEAHFSNRKAAAMLGIGADNVRPVKTDANLHMDLADLDRQVRQDLEAGHLPFCVVASLGTAGTGAVDPLGAIADFAQAHNLWLHVDGAYGGVSGVAASARAFFRRIGEADSVALDPHKWLYLPVGCGCVLYRDPAAARAAFSENAEYTRV